MTTPVECRAPEHAALRVAQCSLTQSQSANTRQMDENALKAGDPAAAQKKPRATRPGLIRFQIAGGDQAVWSWRSDFGAVSRSCVTRSSALVGTPLTTAPITRMPTSDSSAVAW